MSAPLEITAHGDCLLGGQPLHPGQGALQAARLELAPLLGTASSEDTLVLAGLGLGWHARAVLEHDPAPHLLVYEPDENRRAYAAALGPAWPRGAKAVMVQDSEQLIEALAPRMVYAPAGRLAVYCHPAYRLAAPEVLAQAEEMVRRSHSRGQVERANRGAKQRQWLEHLASNFHHVLELTDLSRLARLGRGLTALVVGAGPSLDDSLPELRGIDQQCFVLAAASALKPLASVGVAPHVALAMEAKDESRQWEGQDPTNTILAAACSSHPAHFAAWPGERALYHLQPWVAELLGCGQALPSGGHVTSVAFSLAILMDCHQVILVGQDLAFSGGRQHARRRPGGEDDAPANLVQVPAIGGGLIQTSLVMQSYIAWYQEAAAYLARRPGGAPVINASAQGALLPGFQHMELGQALRQAKTSSVSFKYIAQVLRAQPRPRSADISLRLGLARADLRRARSLLDQKGLAACHQDLAPGSPTAAALQMLAPGAGQDEAREALSFMNKVLRQMAEGLYV
ncbi:MAG: 6-hydroxymethylpterin diphosphokinase MptE-like protein [Pseudomonadota bacterium]